MFSDHILPVDLISPQIKKKTESSQCCCEKWQILSFRHLLSMHSLNLVLITGVPQYSLSQKCSCKKKVDWCQKARAQVSRDRLAHNNANSNQWSKRHQRVQTNGRTAERPFVCRGHDVERRCNAQNTRREDVTWGMLGQYNTATMKRSPCSRGEKFSLQETVAKGSMTLKDIKLHCKP